MGRVVILGVKGSGKTVFLSVLGRMFATTGPLGLQLMEKVGTGTEDFVERAFGDMLQGEWPEATDKGEVSELAWTVQKGPDYLFEIESHDWAGEVVVQALAPRSAKDSVKEAKTRGRGDSGQQPEFVNVDLDAGSGGNAEVENLIRERVGNADVICLFLNPNDFKSRLAAVGDDSVGDARYVAQLRDRCKDMDRLVRTFLTSKTGYGKRLVLVITQAKLPEVASGIEAMGGARAFLKERWTWASIENFPYWKNARVIAVSAVNDIFFKKKSGGRVKASDAHDLAELEGDEWDGNDGAKHYRPLSHPEVVEDNPSSSGLVEFLLAVGGSLSKVLEPLDSKLRALREEQYRHAQALHDQRVRTKERLRISESMFSLWQEYYALAKEYASDQMTDKHLEEEEGLVLPWFYADRALDEAMRTAAADSLSLDSDTQCRDFCDRVVARANEQLDSESSTNREPLVADDLAIPSNPWLRKELEIYRSERKRLEGEFAETLRRGEKCFTKSDADKAFEKAAFALNALLAWMPDDDPAVSETQARLFGLRKKHTKNIDAATAAAALAEHRKKQKRRRKTQARFLVVFAAIVGAFLLVRGGVDRKLAGERMAAEKLAQENLYTNAVARMQSIKGVPFLLLPRSRYVDEDLIVRWEGIAPLGNARRPAEEALSRLKEAEAEVMSRLGTDTARLDALSVGQWKTYEGWRDRFLSTLPEGRDVPQDLPDESLDINRAISKYRAALPMADKAMPFLSRANRAATGQANEFRAAVATATNAQAMVRSSLDALHRTYGHDDRRFLAMATEPWRKFTNLLQRAEYRLPKSNLDEFGLPTQPPFAFPTLMGGYRQAALCFRDAGTALAEVAVTMGNSATAYRSARNRADKDLIVLSEGTIAAVASLGPVADRIKTDVASEWAAFEAARLEAKNAYPVLDEDEYRLPSPARDFQQIRDALDDVSRKCSAAVAKRKAALDRLEAIVAEESRRKAVLETRKALERMVGFSAEGWAAAAARIRSQRDLLSLPGTNELAAALASVVAAGQGSLTGTPVGIPSESVWRDALAKAEEMRKDASTDDDRRYADACVPVCRAAVDVFEEMSRRSRFAKALAAADPRSQKVYLSKAMDAFRLAESEARLEGENAALDAARKAISEAAADRIRESVEVYGLGHSRLRLSQSGFDDSVFRANAVGALEKCLEAKYTRNAPRAEEADFGRIADDLGAIADQIVPLIEGGLSGSVTGPETKRVRAAAKAAESRVGSWSASWLDEAQRLSKDVPRKAPGRAQWDLCRKVETLLEAAVANPFASVDAATKRADRIRSALPMLVRVDFTNAVPTAARSAACRAALGAGESGETCVYLASEMSTAAIVTFDLTDGRGVPIERKQSRVDFAHPGTRTLVLRLNTNGLLQEVRSAARKSATPGSATRKPDPPSADTDGDGIPDSDEVKIHKTNPSDPDSDHDGLWDGEEVSTFKTDPLNPDTDGDGLIDGDEAKIYRTDPLDPDTDHDGLRDGAEIAVYKTDPRNSDTDHDGLGDGGEVDTSKTNPRNSDTDWDWIVDVDEFLF